MSLFPSYVPAKMTGVHAADCDVEAIASAVSSCCLWLFDRRGCVQSDA